VISGSLREQVAEFEADGRDNVCRSAPGEALDQYRPVIEFPNCQGWAAILMRRTIRDPPCWAGAAQAP